VGNCLKSACFLFLAALKQVSGVEDVVSAKYMRLRLLIGLECKQTNRGAVDAHHKSSEEIESEGDLMGVVLEAMVSSEKIEKLDEAEGEE